MIYVIPASMTRIGTIDLRFQSYNVEMLEVTGGKFWKPYRLELDALLLKGQQAGPTKPEGGDTPAGMNPALYRVSTAYRSDQRAAPQTGERAGAGICARQRHVANTSTFLIRIRRRSRHQPGSMACSLVSSGRASLHSRKPWMPGSSPHLQ